MSNISNEKISYIRNYDFSRQKKKMLYPLEASGTGWTKEKIDAVELKYKEWLILLYKHQEDIENIGFDLEIDWFWHHHIMDTISYIEFCRTVFGFYIHHDPYAGMPGEPITVNDLADRYEHYREIIKDDKKAS